MGDPYLTNSHPNGKKMMKSKKDYCKQICQGMFGVKNHARYHLYIFFEKAWNIFQCRSPRSLIAWDHGKETGQDRNSMPGCRDDLCNIGREEKLSLGQNGTGWSINFKLGKCKSLRNFACWTTRLSNGCIFFSSLPWARWIRLESVTNAVAKARVLILDAILKKNLFISGKVARFLEAQKPLFVFLETCSNVHVFSSFLYSARLSSSESGERLSGETTTTTLLREEKPSLPLFFSLPCNSRRQHWVFLGRSDR